jgi:hypothetical protein
MNTPQLEWGNRKREYTSKINQADVFPIRATFSLPFPKQDPTPAASAGRRNRTTGIAAVGWSDPSHPGLG